MKRVLLLAFMLLGMVSIAAAQTSNTGVAGECKLKVAQAPAIRGIHLGMTVDQLLAVFPGSEKDESVRQQLSQSSFGLARATINPSTFSSKERFLGVNLVSVTFFDGELNSFWVEYNGPEWATSDQFASKVAATLSLPALEFWIDSGTQAKVLKCDGFDVRAQMTQGPGTSSISVTNRERDASKAFRERNEAKKNEARRAFKP